MTTNDTITEDITGLEVCVDCAIWQANADDSGMDDETSERVRAVEGHWAIGDQTTDFCSSLCDACGSTLGGARFDATLINVA